MKYVKNVIVDDDAGNKYYCPGDTEHNHMIALTPEDRIQLLESTVKTLEERVASLETQKNKLLLSLGVVRKEK